MYNMENIVNNEIMLYGARWLTIIIIVIIL